MLKSIGLRRCCEASIDHSLIAYYMQIPKYVEVRSEHIVRVPVIKYKDTPQKFERVIEVQ